jgi:hypothetical protein
VDGSIVIATLASFALTAEEDADEPAALATINDLSNATSQRLSSEIWHTAGTLAAPTMLPLQSLRGEDD